MSKKFWDSLNPAEQKIITEAAAESTVYQRQQARLQDVTALDAVKKGGMQVTELSAAELAKFREKMKPVLEKHGASTPEAVLELTGELAKIRAAK